MKAKDLFVLVFEYDDLVGPGDDLDNSDECRGQAVLGFTDREDALDVCRKHADAGFAVRVKRLSEI